MESSECGPKSAKIAKIDDDNEHRESIGDSCKIHHNFNETDAGIKLFIGNHRPFSGVLKNRFEDFIVNEIDTFDNIIHLTDTSLPPDDVKHTVIDIKELLNETQINEIIELEKSQSKSSPSVRINVSHLDKLGRQKIHESIRNNYRNLSSNTMTNDETVYIIVMKGSQNRKNPINWPKDRPNFTHFVMTKKDNDTQSAINLLAKRSHIPVKNFNYAGNKDKRSISTQRVSVWKTEPKRIANSCVNMSKYLRVGNFTFHDKRVHLGNLNGNHFQIVLRDLQFDDYKDIENGMTSVRDTGFINYFGMQRFGWSWIKTYKIGVMIIKEQWKDAVEIFLSPNEYDQRSRHSKPEDPSYNESMNEWQRTRDAETVYKKFQFKHLPEGMLLNGLCKCGNNNYKNALFNSLHRNAVLFYPHCLQSYIWNHAATERVKTYGIRVVLGDLLILNSHLSDNTVKESQEPDDDNEYDDSDVISRYNLVPVYADETNINDATIYDIVLPIVGSNSILPKNSIGQYYNTLLTKEGLNLEAFKTQSSHLNLKGSYRKLFVKPKDFDWSLVEYTDPNVPLIESDFDFTDKIKNKNIVNSDNSGDKKKALKISVSLPTSSYATMLLREITKMDSEDLQYTRK